MGFCMQYGAQNTNDKICLIANELPSLVLPDPKKLHSESIRVRL